MSHTKSLEKITQLSAGDISAVIQMAWEDRTTFETIQERIGVSESDVIKIMRAELKPDSFKLCEQCLILFL
jgi:DNA-directed RNA polymerase specialized sigma subunit